MRSLTIAIIGAGYSGISLLANLQRFSHRTLRILLFEKTLHGLGPAYSTANPVHLLNIPAGNMSAFPDLPDDFVNWLKNNSQAKIYLNSREEIGLQYVPRILYAQYLRELLNNAMQKKSTVTVEYYPNEVTDAEVSQNSFVLLLNNGERIQADKIILAHGNLPPKNFFPQIKSPSNIANPWNYHQIEKINPQSPVFILGTGLTMVDVVMSLLQQGHVAPIYAVSRRGLAPQAHEEFTDSFALDVSQLPNSLRKLIRYVRAAIKTHIANKGNWRAVFQALRPITQELWQTFTLTEKQRFLKHLMPYWDSHRHRIAPEIAATIAMARNNKQLTIMAGTILAAEEISGELVVKIKPRGKSASHIVEFHAGHIVNCTGPTGKFSVNDCPLLSHLHERGIIEKDGLNLGLLVIEQGAIINKSGVATHNIFTLGPPCKGLLWECIAVPDIRQQSLNLARLLGHF